MTWQENKRMKFSANELRGKINKSSYRYMIGSKLVITTQENGLEIISRSYLNISANS